MEHFEKLIEEYAAQTVRVQERIAGLNAEITSAFKAQKEGKAKLLSRRRLMLYHELWEMEESIRRMKEYLQCVRARR